MLRLGSQPSEQQKRLWSYLFVKGLPLEFSTSPTDDQLAGKISPTVLEKDIIDYLQASGSWKDPQSNEKYVIMLLTYEKY